MRVQSIHGNSTRTHLVLLPIVYCSETTLLFIVNIAMSLYQIIDCLEFLLAIWQKYSFNVCS